MNKAFHDRVRLDFYQADGTTFVTTARGFTYPLSSEYKGLEIPQPEIKTTHSFVVPFDLTGTVELGYKIKVGFGGVVYTYVVTGMKLFEQHTEITGLLDQPGIAATEASGIVSEYQFLSSLELGTDAQGANNLSKLNTPAWNNSRPPGLSTLLGAANFNNAENDSLQIDDGDQTGLDLTGSFTIAFRVRFLAETGADQLVMGKYDAGASDGYVCYFATSLRVAFFVGSAAGFGTAFGGSVLSLNQWYSVACVHDDGVDLRIYVDGSLDTLASFNPLTYTDGVDGTSEHFFFGNQSSDCLVSHAFVFSEAKSAMQISTWHANNTWT